MMDTLIQKAWELYQHTARFPVETILAATVWLEEKHRKTPGEKIAMAIALHYLILALRHDGKSIGGKLTKVRPDLGVMPSAE